MIILVINAGSSSLKYKLIDMSKQKVLASGLAERIGSDEAQLTLKREGEPPICVTDPMKNHSEAIDLVIRALTDAEKGVIKNASDIAAVGHRVVHGGERFKKSVIIDDDVLAGIKECIVLAPLHNPPNITGIEACAEVMPNTLQVAVFDTAMHQSMPEMAYTYALPHELYEKYKIRRYGFHGTSHKYVAEQAAEMLGRPLGELKLVTAHLGNGASVAAIKDGISIDTSMGFTPLSGVMMGTRSGDIDPAVVFFLMEKGGFTVSEVNDILNKKSGVLTVSGISNDFRDIEAAANEGNDRAQLALDMFCYKVRKYIGSYVFAMGGADAIIFTAGVGENSAYVRKHVLSDLESLGIEIDLEKNLKRGEKIDISSPNAKIKTLIIPTDEELMIARETAQFL